MRQNKITNIIKFTIQAYCSKKANQNFFSSLVRDEEKTVEDLTGTWFLIGGEENQRIKDCYMTLNEDGTIYHFNTSNTC